MSDCDHYPSTTPGSFCVHVLGLEHTELKERSKVYCMLYAGKKMNSKGYIVHIFARQTTFCIKLLLYYISRTTKRVPTSSIMMQIQDVLLDDEKEST